ncbi:MAG: hypothetical protein L6U61_11910 [Bacteroidales bacterium]|nr:MAG: hypothetical protein L6U61_11910 [Bacteroidales bacterium]
MASNSIGNGSTSFDRSTYNQLLQGNYKYKDGKLGASTDRTNKANLAIARETNAYNYLLASKQNDWNIEQWNRENAYNTPSAQRQRLLDAGLNPNLMLDGGDAGNARGLDSANYANAQPTTMQNPAQEKLGLLQSIQGVLQSANDTAMQYAKQRSEIANLDSQTNAQNIQNSYLRAFLDKNLEKLGHDTTTSKWMSKNSEESYAKTWLENNYMLNYGFKQGRLQNNLTAQTISNLMTEQAFTSERSNLLQKEYQWFDDRVLMDLYEASTRASLNGANEYYAMQQAYKAAEETRGIKLDNDMKDKLFDDVYRASRADLQKNLGYYGKNPYEFGSMLRRNEYSNAFWQNVYSMHRNRNASTTPGIMNSGVSMQNLLNPLLDLSGFY